MRGALLDVWPPSTESPVRVELYGDLVLSMKPFDPIEQKTRKDAPDLKTLWLPPAREAILDAATVARARSRVTQLAEAIDWPTTKTRALVDDVTSARAFFGAEGFLPAYYDELDSLLSRTSRDDAVVVLEDPPSLTRAAARRARARGRATPGRRAGPSFLPGAFYATRSEVVRELEQHARRRPAPHRHRGRSRARASAPSSRLRARSISRRATTTT